MKNINKYYPYILVGFLSFFLNIFLFTSGAYSFIESKFFDLKFKLRGPLYENSEFERDVVIVEIDDESYGLIDESYPYPRGRVYSRVVENLTKAKAKVIVFDIMFDAPDHTSTFLEHHINKECAECSYSDGDAQFVKSIQFAKNQGTEVVLASKIAKDINRVPQDYIVKPNLKIMNSNPQIGLVNQGMDNVDLSNRKYSILSKVSSEPNNYYLSLAIQSILSYKNISSSKITQDTKNDNLIIGGVNIKPFNKEASLLINYYGPTSSMFNTFSTYSLSQVIDSEDYNLSSLEEDDNWIDKYINDNSPFYKYFGIQKSPFKDKIVIIGSSLDEDNDFVLTPFYHYQNIEKNMPGVELHANAIQQILDENYIDVSKFYLSLTSDNFIPQILLIISLILLSLYLSNRKSFFLNTVLIFSMALLWFSYSIGSFLSDQLWMLKYFFNFVTNQEFEKLVPDFKSKLIPVFYPIVSIIVTYGINLSYNLIKEQKNKNFLKETFGRYVSPKIIDVMYNQKKMPELGGECGIRTAYFSDIQAFSTISEQLTTVELVELLNEYLSKQTEIILKHQGTLDKYEGDAILAFFGAPMFFEEHAKAALDSSLYCQFNLIELNKKWSQEKDKWPEIVQTMKMRVGVNTGEMVTGNMGSKYHMNYTMIGDVVNIAARLESSAKQYGIYLHSTEETLENAGKDNYLWRYIDRIQFVGKTVPVQTVEIINFNEKNDSNVLKLVKTYHAALECYYDQKWDEAIELLTQSSKLEIYLHNNEINPSDIFLKRAKDFKNNPPNDDWDGSYKLTSK